MRLQVSLGAESHKTKKLYSPSCRGHGVGSGQMPENSQKVMKLLITEGNGNSGVTKACDDIVVLQLSN